jgi:hypothetical protein
MVVSLFAVSERQLGPRFSREQSRLFENQTKNPYGPITESESTIFEKAKAQERWLFHDLRAARAAEPAAPAFGLAPR